MAKVDTNQFPICLPCPNNIDIRAYGREDWFCDHLRDGPAPCCYQSVPDPLGPGAPTITNAAGGKQSDSPYRMDLLDPVAMFAAAEVLKKCADKYGVDNWRLIPAREHLNHTLVHIYAWLDGNKADDHLAHALCRAIFAVAMERKECESHV